MITMKKAIKNSFVIICLFLQTTSFSQFNTGSGPGADGSIRMNLDLNAFKNQNIYTGEKLLNDLDPNVKNLRYNDVKGTPFWNDKWFVASLYDIKNQLIAKAPVNMNFANGKIYTIKGDSILELESETIRKVVMYTDEASTTVKAVFLNFLPYTYINSVKINDYIQVFHSGPAILLKYKKKELTQSEGGGGMPKYYYFKDAVYYFVQIGTKSEMIKKLSLDVVLKLLPGAFSLQGWIKDQKLNLKKEEDVIKFIEYYNSLKEKEGN